jgi:plasmid stabilization system protein ParE
MRIIFTEDAKSDLEELRRYLEPLSPKGLANVVAALERRIAIASENPRSGRPTPRPDVREAVEPRYGFVIPYTLIADDFYVLRVYRSMRRPLDYSELKI